MCGRYVIFDDRDIAEVESILREINSKYGEGAVTTGEIFPTNNAPVFVARQGELQPELMTWGFPQYNSKGFIINARAETAHEKRTFAPALLARRCVIPSTGFYEWTHATAKKEKYLFTAPNETMLYMAGIYNLQPDGLHRYVVLTTAANDSMKAIHERMPVILRKSELTEWIEQKESVPEILARVPIELEKRKVG